MKQDPPSAQEFPAYYETRRFITVFTRAHNLNDSIKESLLVWYAVSLGT